MTAVWGAAVASAARTGVVHYRVYRGEENVGVVVRSPRGMGFVAYRYGRNATVSRGHPGVFTATKAVFGPDAAVEVAQAQRWFWDHAGVHVRAHDEDAVGESYAVELTRDELRELSFAAHRRAEPAESNASVPFGRYAVAVAAAVAGWAAFVLIAAYVGLSGSCY